MRSKSNSHQCISRIQIDSPKKTRGWQVRITRSGKQFTKFFSDSKFGGKDAALKAAVQVRDQTIKQLGGPAAATGPKRAKAAAPGRAKR